MAVVGLGTEVTGAVMAAQGRDDGAAVMVVGSAILVASFYVAILLEDEKESLPYRQSNSGYASTLSERSESASNSRCSFRNCNRYGWKQQDAEGRTIHVTCRFDDCNKNGWFERDAQFLTTTVTCRFDDCNANGRTELDSHGHTTQVTCHASDCNRYGWSEQRPDGTTSECSCKFGDCLTNGVTCD